MAEHDISTKRSWLLKIKDIKDKVVSLKITCPISYNFDSIFLLLIDVSDFSSVTLLVNSQHEELGIQLNSNLNPKKFKVHIYGLKHAHSENGRFDFVECYGENEPNGMEEHTTSCIELKEPKDEHVPLDNPTQGTLPVTVYRHPPSFYRLDVNHTFKDVQDFVIFVKIKDQTICFFVSNKQIHLPFPFELPSASEVTCKVVCGSRQWKVPGSLCIAKTTSHSKTIIFKTYFSLEDNYRLYQLAIAFDARKAIPGLKPIQYLYRNKSVEYFNIIRNQLNGEMRPYLKSNTGDQGSVLNGKISGLFFSTFLEDSTSRPNPYSHYGPMRLYVLPEIIFNPFCNIYFADFYCHYKRHHVTIVVTPKASVSDRFCAQYLLPLNIFNNPYLCLRCGIYGSFIALANMKVTVEVFYTETINVLEILRTNMGYFERTLTVGRGYALPSGMPKNATCKICNLG